MISLSACLCALRGLVERIASRLQGEVATGSHDASAHFLGPNAASLVSWGQWPDSARQR